MYMNFVPWVLGDLKGWGEVLGSPSNDFLKSSSPLSNVAAWPINAWTDSVGGFCACVCVSCVIRGLRATMCNSRRTPHKTNDLKADILAYNFILTQTNTKSWMYEVHGAWLNVGVPVLFCLAMCLSSIFMTAFLWFSLSRSLSLPHLPPSLPPSFSLAICSTTICLSCMHICGKSGGEHTAVAKGLRRVWTVYV
jgi:hypothetical protein